VDVPAFDVAANVAREISEGCVFVWENAGRIVSMAKWGAGTRHTARVRLVFTPSDDRGKGYASACVAALSQRLLDGGRARVCLNAVSKRHVDRPLSALSYRQSRLRRGISRQRLRQTDGPRRRASRQQGLQ
jgi:hypothetical protein